MRWMDNSVSSPERISLRMRLEISLDRPQYSRRFMSRPFTSIFSTHLPSASTMLMAAYFFFGLKQDAAENVVDINLEQAVPLVDGLLEVGADLERVGDRFDICVDHDRVRVTVDDLRRDLLSASSLVLRRISRPLKVVRTARGRA